VAQYSGFGGGIREHLDHQGLDQSPVVGPDAPQAKLRSNCSPVGRSSGATVRAAERVRKVVQPAETWLPVFISGGGNASTKQCGGLDVLRDATSQSMAAFVVRQYLKSREYSPVSTLANDGGPSTDTEEPGR
jgi:hypothetical protein